MDIKLDKNPEGIRVPSITISDKDSTQDSDFVQTEHAAQPFKSRFKTWIRMVALVVLFVFVPEQISWAFHYNPAVLWGSRGDAAPVVSADLGGEALAPEALASAQLASSIKHLLGQVANQKNVRLELTLTPDPRDASTQKSVLIDAQKVVTSAYIDSVVSWLREPEIHPLNCGVYALQDLLASRDVPSSLEEVSIATLTVDLLNDIVLPGDEFLKTSLFALERVAKGYGLPAQAVRVDPADLLLLRPPFIANFGSEHFVTVQDIAVDGVTYTDIGQTQVLPRQDFVEKASGFVLALNPERQRDVAYEPVTDAVKAFVWGNRWVDKSDQLPGLLSGGDLLMHAAVSVVGAVLSLFHLRSFKLGCMA